MGMELARGQMESQAIQRGIFKMLQTFMERFDDKSPFNAQPSQPIEDRMETLQTVRIVLSDIVYATLCQFRNSWVHLCNRVKGGRFQKDFRWPPIVKPLLPPCTFRLINHCSF